MTLSQLHKDLKFYDSTGLSHHCSLTEEKIHGIFWGPWSHLPNDFKFWGGWVWAHGLQSPMTTSLLGSWNLSLGWIYKGCFTKFCSWIPWEGSRKAVREEYGLIHLGVRMVLPSRGVLLICALFHDLVGPLLFLNLWFLVSPFPTCLPPHPCLPSFSQLPATPLPAQPESVLPLKPWCSPWCRVLYGVLDVARESVRCPEQAGVNQASGALLSGERHLKGPWGYKHWDFPGGPMVKTEFPMQGTGASSIPSQGTRIPHAMWRDQNKL